MNKKFIVLFAAACTLFSCGNKTDQGDPEKDSLNQVIAGQQMEMSDMNLFLDAVNASMDSIVNMEGQLLRVNGESPASKKQQIKRNLEAYKMIIERQKERLAKLEESLKASGAKSEKLMQTIATLKAQIEQKDALILELNETIQRKNFDITQLQGHVERLSQNVVELQEDNQQKDEVITQQADLMNEAYVFIGDKSALKAAGLLSGGNLFKKSKLDMSAVDASKFRKIDIRKVTSFSIPGKKPTLLTQAPAGSYTITEVGNGTCTLTITNPSAFWSVSNFLVVRY